MLSLIGNAQREILLWIASASSYRALLPLLVQRVEADVKVGVLLADVEAVESVRGTVSTGLARTTIADWRATFRGKPTLRSASTLKTVPLRDPPNAPRLVAVDLK